MKILSEQAVGTAHGKIILIGEHSVVYNEPAIALPFPVAFVEVTIQPILGDSTIECSYFEGKLAEAPSALENLVKTTEAVCHELNTSFNGMHIVISSVIPPERGMGSSAAVASALVRALFRYFNRSLDDQTLLKFVQISEKISHGNPSGLDARVVSGSDPVYYLKEQLPETFNLVLSGVLVAADTGLKGQTREAVQDVANLLKKSSRKTKRIVNSLGTLTKKARKAIEQDDIHVLGSILSKAHHHLSDLSVSNETLDELVQTAMDHGALGAKLTGGGRGGCIIALTDTVYQAKTVAAELMKAGAVETWIHPLGAEKNEEI